MEYDQAWCLNCRKVTKHSARENRNWIGRTKESAYLCCDECHYVSATLYRDTTKEMVRYALKQAVMIIDGLVYSGASLNPNGEEKLQEIRQVLTEIEK